MNKELIIRSSSEAVDFALLKDGKLIELHKEEEKSNFQVGDIFIAKVRKPVAGLNAAFVNVGHDKDAFLHYHDLGPNLASQLKFIKLVSAGKIKDFNLKNFQFEKEIDKDGTVLDILSPNQSILVQVVKEPISTKGPRISSELSLAGRFIVLVPFSDRVSVSQKIEIKGEKERLKRLVQSIKPKGFGVIVRTVAEGKNTAELEKDLQNLMNRWTAMSKKLPTAHQAGIDKFLFGQAATLLNSDIMILAIISGIVVATILIAWKELKIISFDPNFAQAIGLPVKKIQALLLIVIVLTVIVGLQTVGLILMSSFLIAPAAAARQWTCKLHAMIFLSILFSLIATTTGTIISCAYAHVPTGPTIVIIATMITLISIIIAPSGIIATQFRQRYNFKNNS